MTIKRKILFLTILSYLILMIVFYVFILNFYKKNFIKSRLKTGESILIAYSDNLVYAGIIENKEMIASYVSSLMKTKFIDYIIVKKNNSVIFSNKNSKKKAEIVIIESKTVKTISEPATISIILGLNINDFTQNLRNVMVFLGICLLFFTIVFSIIIYYIVTKSFYPVNLIINKMKKLSIGNYEKFEKINYQDFNPIVETFNDLVDKLKEKDERIKQQLKEISDKNKNLQEKLAEIASLQQIIIQKEKLASLGTIVAGIAHEINNPIAAIRGLCELTLIKQNIDNKTIKNLNKIINYCDKIADIIKTLKVYGKSGELSQKEYWPISNIIEDAIEMEKHGNILKEIKIKGNFKKFSDKILCIKDEILQVFINLINNSVEAMDGKGEIYIDIHKYKDFLEVHFRDTGPGIPEEIKDKIFEPFFTTKNIEGTGLGLYIVYTIIQKNNGEIYLKDSKKGAYFVIKFRLGGENEKGSNNR